jgi:recombination protein RecT
MSNALALLHEDIYGTRDTFVSVRTDDKLNFEKEAGFAIQAITANDYACSIAMKNRQSVVNAVTNIAAIGISLNPAKKQAYLVPRDGRICLDISYMGLLDLAIQSGAIHWGQAELVYEVDGFSLNNFDKPPTHQRNPFAKDRGAIVGVYVVVKTSTGDYLTSCMSIGEVYEIRDRSSAWKAWVDKQRKCPWVTDEGEMIKKTVIKRAYKMWPKAEKSSLERAIHYLNTDGGEGLADIGNTHASSAQHNGTPPGGAPKDGYMEKLSIEAQEYLRELASNLDAAFRSPESGIAIAYDMVKAENLDEAQEIALWSLLASDLRREMKVEGKARRDAAKQPA